MSLESTTYTPEITTILKNFFATQYGGQKDEGAVAAAVSNLTRDGPIMEEQLSKHDYLAGDKFTLVDIIWPTYVWYIKDEPEMKQWFAQFPHITEHYERVTARPAFQQTLALIK